jgi:hypothetical protein
MDVTSGWSKGGNSYDHGVFIVPWQQGKEDRELVGKRRM